MVRLLLLFMPFILLANENIGEKIYMTKGCYGCHGTKGEGIGTYPKLAGKPVTLLIEKLNKLKKGIGQTSKRDLMIPFAKALSKKEIEEVSKYLSLININDKGEDIADEYLGGFGS
ncbi:c-type cytochrome [Hydrogenimonas thermophila]|uniref:c-type cytochrome n=1 Tax=Hydrogenimonas thermophila TaxID=223786 RepID=UPI00293730DD|nr:c-type cytochrome [Hydrogenimonas thermophila]WOE71002.1 c-type cytochrome [Hydrogenimonas thermophila]WOE73520.1 c-type cytochrome [Hydrogenimonas thermophila]